MTRGREIDGIWVQQQDEEEDHWVERGYIFHFEGDGFPSIGFWLSFLVVDMVDSICDPDGVCLHT